MFKYVNFFAFALMSLITILKADDQAFYPDRESSFVCLFYSHYDTDQFWDRKGRTQPSYNYFDQSIYRGGLQYRFSLKHVVFAQAGYRWIQEELNGRTLGIEDYEIGWRYALYPPLMTAQVIAIFPAGPHKSSLRYGSFGLELALFFSKEFKFFCHEGFIDCKLGYRAYQGFPSDQMRGHLHLGYWPYRWCYLIAGTQFEYEIGNKKMIFNENNIVFHSHYGLVKAIFIGSVCLYSQASLIIGYSQHLWGYHIGKGYEIFTQFAYHF